MRHRVNLLVSVVFLPVLAAAMLLGAGGVAPAAEGCFEKPGREVNQGHWYYRSDRVHHRRCWYFEPAEGAATPASNADDVPWLYRLAAGLVGVSFAPKQNSVSGTSADSPRNNISANSLEPTQNGVPSNSGSKTASPKHSLTRKIVRQEAQFAPPPTTTGLSSAQPDQLQNAAEEDEKQAPPLTDAERQSLFQEFLKWYRDRGVYNQP